MIYSYTQISQYLACPRRYRHRIERVEAEDRAARLRSALLLDPGKLAVLQRYTAPTKDGDTGPWRDWSDCRDKGTARLFRLQSMCR